MEINQWGFIIGLMAAVLSTVSFLPQAIQIFKTKHTKDISLVTFIILSFGIFLWLIYGILIMQTPVILANSVTLVLVIAILVMKIKYG
ncbi:MAG: SemiSWEET transporter [Candidatus Omnitrophica bacterium]|nr:SemiSWEET transporter [Candidatus Omnitrophota bacterium]MBU1047836.1 SemiSWEET transporter [Candidatus Omnitrophota bacterium]MBU1630520.1 SemiSWEET transporter [Candidatus Omnitrophota bacterium]MBU1767552.1 SemiSWEET transporter [Candidatus Omnitrophota bacterium]MBU1888458.1 SemiSWEET transporter [Candidatus Omnitrophota bacterium]